MPTGLLAVGRHPGRVDVLQREPHRVRARRRRPATVSVYGRARGVRLPVGVLVPAEVELEAALLAERDAEELVVVDRRRWPWRRRSSSRCSSRTRRRGRGRPWGSPRTARASRSRPGRSLRLAGEGDACPSCRSGSSSSPPRAPTGREAGRATAARIAARASRRTMFFMVMVVLLALPEEPVARRVDRPVDRGVAVHAALVEGVPRLAGRPGRGGWRSGGTAGRGAAASP